MSTRVSGYAGAMTDSEHDPAADPDPSPEEEAPPAEREDAPVPAEVAEEPVEED